MSEGLRDEGVTRFAALAKESVDRGEVPGLVALVASGDDVHVAVEGAQTLDGAPMRRDTLFRIASLTKPISAAAAMTLVADGLDLDEPVDSLCPELASRRVLTRLDARLDETVPAARAIAVRDLLTFTFGFGVAMEMFTSPAELPIVRAEREAGLHTLGPPAPDLQPEPDAYLARLGALPLIAQPGERWLYNTGASVLGVLLARADERPFDEVLRTRLFDPIGMDDTSMWTKDPDRLATAYAASDDGFEVWDDPDGQWSRPPAFPDGAAGLVSTVDDLHRFAQCCLDRGAGVIPAPLVDAMTTNHLTDEQRAREGGAILQGSGWGFCQAVVTDGPRTGAFGWTGGLGTSWLVDPARALTVIVMTQRLFTSPVLPNVHEALQSAAFEAVG
jgi:CubicO group peptidase (beta-lactamase class C family)